MRALKMNYGGAGKVSVDFGAEVSGIKGVAQRAVGVVMTNRGSNKFLPDFGTDVTRKLLGYGVFDFVSMQHTLNFGALKALSDAQDYEGDRQDDAKINNIQMSLVDVHSNVADVSVSVSSVSGGSTQQITEVA